MHAVRFATAAISGQSTAGIFLGPAINAVSYIASPGLAREVDWKKIRWHDEQEFEIEC
jgi:hypothetical protein